MLYEVITNTKVSWDFEKEGYEAEFEINEKDASESYDFNGKKIASEIEIEKRELPQNILQYLSKNYPKNKIKETVITSYSIHYTKLYDYCIFEIRSIMMK